MSIFLRSGAKWLERLMWLKYYNVQKWQITFTLGLNAAKNTNYLKNTSRKSCLKKFVNSPKVIRKFPEIRKNNINISPPPRLINIISPKILFLFKKSILSHKNHFLVIIDKTNLIDEKSIFFSVLQCEQQYKKHRAADKKCMHLCRVFGDTLFDSEKWNMLLSIRNCAKCLEKM